MLKIKKSVFSSITILGIIFCFLLQANIVEAAKTTSSIHAGSWETSTNWSNGVPAEGDSVNVNNLMTIANNLSIISGGVYTFNVGSSGTICPFELKMATNSVLNIYGNVTFTGGMNLNGGTIHVYNGATLTFPGTNEAKANIIVDSGANLVINGNLLNNHGDIQVDGLITITGNYDGQDYDAIVTGMGNITTVGYMKGINQSRIFDTKNPYCPSNCDGRNLFGGGGSCGRTVNFSITSSSICAGSNTTLSCVFAAGGTNISTDPIKTQWQIKNASGFFVNISGATTNSYSPSPTETTTYRVVLGASQNQGQAYCYSYSSNIIVTVAPCLRTWVGGTVGALTDWNTNSNWSPAIIPTYVEDVTIPNVTNKPVITSGATANAKSININPSSSLTLNSTATLNVYGSIKNSGSFTANTGSTVAFVGNTAQTITGVSSLYNTKVDNSAGVTIVSGISNAIKLKGKLSLTSGGLTTNSNLTIDFTSGGNIGYNLGDAGSINGVVTGYRSGVGAKTHFICSPFNGVTSAQVGAFTPLWVSPYWKMYSRNFATQNWDAVTNTSTTLSIGSGFTLSFVNESYMSFTGTYDHNSVFTSPIYTNADSGKYIMVGNPYPATLDWNNEAGWTKTNIGGTIYFWDGPNNRATSYNSSSPGVNGATQYIPAMSAFMFTTTGPRPITSTTSPIVSTSSLKIKKNACTSQNTSYWRTGSDDKSIRLKLTAENATIGDEAVINFIEDATAEFDISYDGYKMMSSGLTPSLYTSLNGVNYSINVLPSLDEVESIPVCAKIPADGNYVLDITIADPTIEAVLIDKKLGTENLVSGPSYTFSGKKTDNANRFELKFRTSTTTGINSLTASSATLSIYSSNKGFVVKADKYVGDIATIEILDVTGKYVETLNPTILSTASTFIPLDIADGAYFVKLTVNEEMYIQMISFIK